MCVNPRYRFASRALPQRVPAITLEGPARPESGKRRPDHGIIAGGLLRVHPWVSLGFSRGLGEERAHEWTKGLATARRACKLARLVLANRQGESHRTLAFVAVVFVHGHRSPSDWPEPRSVTRTKRSDTIAFRSPGKSQCEECRLLDDLVCPRQERGGNREAERLGGFEIDVQLKPGGLLDWEIRAGA